MSFSRRLSLKPPLYFLPILYALLCSLFQHLLLHLLACASGAFFHSLNFNVNKCFVSIDSLSLHLPCNINNRGNMKKYHIASKWACHKTRLSSGPENYKDRQNDSITNQNKQLMGKRRPFRKMQQHSIQCIGITMVLTQVQ